MLTIIGCGNLNRSDDGVGVMVAQRLMEWVNAHAINDVAVFDAGTAGMEVMFRARGAKRLLIIDASNSGSDPGAVFRVPGTELELDHVPAYSLHDFRWDHALYAGRRIFGTDFPADVTVFLIEAAELGLGFELSTAVRNAADIVIADIQHIIKQHAAQALNQSTGICTPMSESAKIFDPHSIRIAKGSLYLSSELCQLYLPDINAIALLIRDNQVYLLPLHSTTAGGMLLKMRNAHGDRVAHALEFLLTIGIDADSPEQSYPARWITEIAGLQLAGLQTSTN